jgi:hypothetical protein
MPTLPPNIFGAELSVGAVRAELLPASVRVKEPKELVNPPMNILRFRRHSTFCRYPAWGWYFIVKVPAANPLVPTMYVSKAVAFSPSNTVMLKVPVW